VLISIISLVIGMFSYLATLFWSAYPVKSPVLCSYSASELLC